MKINPGGSLDLEDIIGRDALVHSIRESLKQQSVILVAERRMGKTHVLKKLCKEAPAGWTMLYRDVEGVRTPAEFVQTILADLHPHLTTTKQFRDWLNAMVGELSGTKVGPLTLPNFQNKHWKQALHDTMAHVQSANHLEQVVFLWDELPWMIQNIARINAQDAMELLDVLRSLRQQHPKLRMVFTGSIGLHHIVRQLKSQGYNTAPTNDMMPVEVKPLDPANAELLAANLLQDIAYDVQNTAIAANIAQEVDGIPYYIHHVLADIDRRPAPKAPLLASDLRRLICTAIQSPHDTWNLKHYEDRTKDYYGAQRDACLTLLDGLAASGTQTQQVAINGAKASHPDIKQNEWLDLIRLLERDYYLLRDPETGQLAFKFTVVRRWWQWNRLGMPIMTEEAAP